MLEIVDRKTAMALGLKWFFTGKPCSRGHLSERRVDSKNCRECARERSRKFHIEHRESEKEKKRKYRLEHPNEYHVNRERLKENKRRYAIAHPERIRARNKRNNLHRTIAVRILKELGIKIQLEENSNA